MSANLTFVDQVNVMVPLRLLGNNSEGYLRVGQRNNVSGRFGDVFSPGIQY